MSDNPVKKFRWLLGIVGIVLFAAALSTHFLQAHIGYDSAGALAGVFGVLSGVLFVEALQS